MKRLFAPYASVPKLDLALLSLRVVIGCFMLTHGLPKMYKLMDGDFAFADPIGLGAQFSLILAVITEVLFAFLLIAGFATRIAAFGLLFTLGVAAFIFHSGDSFSDKESALLYFVIYTFLFITGGGKYSCDSLIYKKLKK